MPPRGLQVCLFRSTLVHLSAHIAESCIQRVFCHVCLPGTFDSTEADNCHSGGGARGAFMVYISSRFMLHSAVHNLTNQELKHVVLHAACL